MSLRPPPKEDAPSRVLLRMSLLILLVLGVGVAVWTAVTEQRIELIEDVALEEVERDAVTTEDGTDLAVVREGEGETPLVLLHDIDVAGSVIWDGVVERLDPRFRILRVDLPGFGLSERITVEGSRHTVASMAEQLAGVVEAEFETPVYLAGVGLGGEVGAEIAVIRPDLVAGLMMIDVDFYKDDGWDELVQKLPWVGRAASFALETAGPFAADRWAPLCNEGGWCPSPEQGQARDLAETIEGTSDSVRAFYRTPAASQVPSKLSEITAPVTFLWSEAGAVPAESVDRVRSAMPAARIEALSESWKAHLDQPGEVAALISDLAG